jgi:peptidoglycan/xylan/chitin deacetylase (PgdA/CDA1 family)
MKVTIVMYHYVRELVHSRYPNIKGLSLEKFNGQLDYLLKNYQFITTEQLVDHLYKGKSLPENAALLTFDDAYIDHFNHVFPILNRKGIQGSFYPPVQAIIEKKVLDVNKVHFILASVDDTTQLLNEIKIWLAEHPEIYHERSFHSLYAEYARANRFDPEEVIFIKRLLQMALPENVRLILTDYLFRLFIGIEESAFSRELYMNEEQIGCLIRNGMHIGSHGYAHYWLGTLPYEKQLDEIQRSKKQLLEWGVDSNYLTMCYPYGNYNNDTLNILEKEDFKLAFCTQVGVADTKKDERFTLPRLDTVDLPFCLET